MNTNLFISIRDYPPLKDTELNVVIKYEENGKEVTSCERGIYTDKGWEILSKDCNCFEVTKWAYIKEG